MWHAMSEPDHLASAAGTARGRDSRRLGRRDFLRAAGAYVGATSIALMGARTSSEAASTDAATLVYGLGFDLDDTMDPQVTNWVSTIRVTLNICEPLVLEPAPGRFVPCLAESWQASPDAKTYTFRLRKGVKFHDGTAFTAEAVKFTLDRVVDPQTKAGASHDSLGPYDHTEIIDDYTAKIVMRQGFAPLVSNLATGLLGIVSPSAVRRMGLADFARHPIGTGPFMFKEWALKDHVTLVRNPNYNWASSFFKHRGPAYLEQIVFKVIPEASTRTGTLKSGETQYGDDMDLLQYAALGHDARFVVIEKGQLGSGYTLLLNTTSKGPIGDRTVRVALEYAIDREGLNKSVFHGLNKVAWSPVMRPTFGYDPATEKIYRFDPAKAKDLLDQAGGRAGADGIRQKDGARLVVDWPLIGRPLDKAIAESVQASVHDVGVELRVTPLERAAYYDLIRQNRYDVNLMWYSSGDPDVLRTLFHSANVTAFNRAKYQVPEVDHMLEEAVATTSKSRRAALYAQIQERILQDAVAVPLVDTITHNAKRAEVEGDYLDALANYMWTYDVRLKKA
jgi:peptide/nickel transport system substrate-binding protein